MKKTGYLRKKSVECFIHIILIVLSLTTIILSSLLVKHNDDLKNALISIGCSILGASSVSLIFIIKDIINTQKEANELIKRIVDKSCYFFIYSIIFHLEYLEGKNASEFINNEIGKYAFVLNDRARAYKIYLYNDLSKCQEEFFTKEEWEGINSTRTYLELLLNSNNTIEGNNLKNIFICLSKIPDVDSALNQTISSFKDKDVDEYLNFLKANIITPLIKKISNKKTSRKIGNSSKLRPFPKPVVSKLRDDSLKNIEDILKTLLKKGIIKRSFSKP